MTTDNSKYWVDRCTGESRYAFEEFYRNVEDPWGCKESVDSVYNNILLECIGLTDHECVLDYGCGLGHFTNRISTKYRQASVYGFDISETAISIAKSNYKPPFFSKENFLVATPRSEYPLFDTVILSECLWYLCSDLQTFSTNLVSSMSESSSILIKQFFPDHQQYFIQYTSLACFTSTYLQSGFRERFCLDFPVSSGTVSIALLYK